METRALGSLRVSVVGLGTNNFGRRMDEHAAVNVVRASLDSGINFFDTADVYGTADATSEEILGRALGKRRDEVVIATKFGVKLDDQHFGARPDYVRSAAEASLKRLGTDHIDLYLLHQPDPSTPIAETLAAMNQLVQEGKVLEIGCSNFSAELLREAEAAVTQGAARFVNLQDEYSLLMRDVEDSILPECERADMTFVPYYPLASGVLTGKYRRNEPLPEGTRLARNERTRDRFLTETNLTIVENLAKYVSSRDHSLLDAAIAWLLHQPVVVSVIAGATSPTQVYANVAAASWKMTDAEADETSRLATKIS